MHSESALAIHATKSQSSPSLRAQAEEILWRVGYGTPLCCTQCLECNRRKTTKKKKRGGRLSPNPGAHERGGVGDPLPMERGEGPTAAMLPDSGEPL